MSTDPAIGLHRSALQCLAEMNLSVARLTHARVEACQGGDLAGFLAAARMFADLGRSLRLTIALDLRLSQPLAASSWATRQHEAVSDIEPADHLTELRDDSVEPRERAEGPERETLSDSERDGFPMDPLGRVHALERIITRNPDLDPDHKVSAQIIELKAFLSEPDPPTPAPPEPPAINAGSPATPGRPPNRAERRRLRHASG